MSPFEIRLELLKMALDLSTQEFFTKKEQLTNQWSMECETARLKGIEPPNIPPQPSFPTEKEIITKAETLNVFVSSIPTETNKNNRKTN